MAFVAPCPRCGRKLQVPTACEGAVVRCPACEATFAVLTAQQAEAQAALNSTTASASEGVVTLAQVPVWTKQAAWHRVHSGLGWIAVGLVIGFVVLFLQYLPALLAFFGIELVSLNDDEFWSQQEIIRASLRYPVGLALLLFSACTFSGLLRCLLYPARGPGSLLPLGTFVLFVLWSLGWLIGDATNVYYAAVTQPSPESEQSRTTVLNWLGALQLGVLVLFLGELGRECGDRTVLARLWSLLIASAALLGLAFLHELLAFVGMVILNALLIRLVLAAREAAGRQIQSPTFAVL
jgi:hypothetical protein